MICKSFIIKKQYCYGIEIEINDDQIELYIKRFAILYADDTIFMSDDEKHFQNLLNYFAEYCKRCHLKTNINNTKIMI